jgi:hypothetical protein
MGSPSQKPRRNLRRQWSPEPRPKLEVALCSLFTILPDYLFRRYWQRRQITMYSIWYELRWGLTACSCPSSA